MYNQKKGQANMHIVSHRAFRSTLLLGLLLLAAGAVQAGEVMDSPQPSGPQPTGPVLIHLFPLGVGQGTSSEIEILGTNLDGTYDVWVDTPAITFEFKKVEATELRLKKGKNPEGKYLKTETESGHRVLLQVEVDQQAPIGPHAIRLVTRQGVSNSAIFWVNSDPVIEESGAEHQTVKEAQRVSVPVAINGCVLEEGEADYYAFEVSEGQKLTFEVIDGVQRSMGDFIRSPGYRMDLYGSNASWFDPQRVTRLGGTNTTVSGLMQFKYAASYEPRLTYRFHEKGLYQVRVTGEFGSSYQLQIAPPEHFLPRTRQQGFDLIPRRGWLERDFTRRLEPDRIQALWNRSTNATEPQLLDVSLRQENPRWLASSVQEQEPNEEAAQALQASIPFIVEGTVQSPGDVDRFSFKVQRGQALAFELETPQKAYPYFNPHLTVLDGEGEEVFNNFYRRLASCMCFSWNTVETKTIFTFAQEGEYLVQIRDISKQHGGPDFSYRLMIRPQIPHIGEVEVAEILSILEREGHIEIDRINLSPGEAKKLTVFTSREEGLDEEIAITVDNLPEGVEVYPASEVDIFPVERGDKKKRFAAVVEPTTLLLVAGPDAPVTGMPRFIRFNVHAVQPGRITRLYKMSAERDLKPIRNGMVGPRLQVHEVPLMIVAPSKDESFGRQLAGRNPDGEIN